jgi:predicted nucleic acid-binding protein
LADLGATDGGGSRKGPSQKPRDMIIAAIAEANECIVVTDNEKDFAGLKIVNPLRASS